MENEDYLDLPEAVKYSNLSQEYLSFLVENKLIPSEKQGDRVLVAKKSLDAFSGHERKPAALPLKNRAVSLPSFRPFALLTAAVVLIIAVVAFSNYDTSRLEVASRQGAVLAATTIQSNYPMLDRVAKPLLSAARACFNYWWIYPPIVLLVLLDWSLLARKRHKLTRQSVAQQPPSL